MVTSINPSTFHKSLRMEYRVYYLLYGVIFSIVISTSKQINISMDCITDYDLTSPNYPSLYPNDAYMEWYFTSPVQRRILVTFHDFTLEDFYDHLVILDILNPRNTKLYMGEDIPFPPFLTQGYGIRLSFTTSQTGRRKGFNISVSCYETSGSVAARLVDGPSPAAGFLELSSQSGEWTRVCEDSITDIVAEVICGELGYSGMKEVTYVEGECLSDHINQTCTRAPTCQDYTYRLEDCEPMHSPCPSHMVKINCYEPGYTGCFNSENMDLQDRLPFISTARCISSCKTDDIQAVAIMNQEDCFCTTSAKAKLEDASKCKEETEALFKMSVYSASFGFCEDLNDTIGGFWDSNITWFGSIVHLICKDGYSLNGSDTLQCVPGVTPYFPEWNDTMPSCIMDGSTTEAPKSGRRKTVLIAVFAVITIIILIVIVFAGCYKWRRKCHCHV